MMNVEGIITAMVTPFDCDEELNLQATTQLIEHLIDKGISGIFILGTNGEFHVMSKEQKLEFAKMVVKIVNGRVPVYAGTGSNSTREVIALTNEMEQIGVDAVSVITPYLLKLSDEELYKHYLKIASEVNLPVILYNIPKNTGNNLSPELVAKLARIDNIVAIKDSSGDINNLEAYIRLTKDQNFSVVSGSDSLILKALELGATGAVAATSNALTEIDVAIYKNFKAGFWDKANYYQKEIEEFRRILKHATVPAVLKYAIELNGIPVGCPKKPVLPIEDRYVEDIQSVMNYYKKINRDIEEV